MVSKKDIKGLDFNTIEEYFEYILNSRTNGQHNQAKKLYNDLSVKQKNNFINWFLTSFHYEREDEGQTEREMLKELLNYLND